MDIDTASILYIYLDTYRLLLVESAYSFQRIYEDIIAHDYIF